MQILEDPAIHGVGERLFRQRHARELLRFPGMRLWQETLRSRQEAKPAVFDFIEGWYNTQRRHSGLDYISPLAYEKRYWLAS